MTLRKSEKILDFIVVKNKKPSVCGTFNREYNLCSKEKQSRLKKVTNVTTIKDKI